MITIDQNEPVKIAAKPYIEKKPAQPEMTKALVISSIMNNIKTPCK